MNKFDLDGTSQQPQEVQGKILLCLFYRLGTRLREAKGVVQLYAALCRDGIRTHRRVITVPKMLIRETVANLCAQMESRMFSKRFRARCLNVQRRIKLCLVGFLLERHMNWVIYI